MIDNKENKTLFMLMVDIVKMNRCLIKYDADKVGINTTYSSILFYLTNNDGSTQLDIVNFTRMTAPTISLTLQKMEIEELIIRKQDNKDLRITRVYITDKGRNTQELFKKIIHSHDEKILSELSNEEKEQLERILNKLIKVELQELGYKKDENI